MRNNNTQKIIASVVGLAIVFIVIVGLVYPGVGATDPTLSTSIPSTPRPPATSTPAPASYQVEGQVPYISNTGFFQVFQPAGTSWLRYQDNYVPSQNRVNVIFRGDCAVIHDFIQVGINYDSLDTVNTELFTDTYFASEWAQYAAWEISKTANDGQYLILDFELKGRLDAPSCPEDYAGRQISWLGENGLLYNVRLVVRKSDQASLTTLQELSIPNFVAYPHNLDVIDRGWQARYTPAQRAMIVLANTWQSETSAGRFASYRGTDKFQGYRVALQEFENTPLATLEDAQAWLQGYRGSAVLLGDESVSQPYANGYILSYSYHNSDGDPFSAVISLLNDEDGKLYSAEIVTPLKDTDLLGDEADENIFELQAIIRSFTILSPDVLAIIT